MELYLSEPLVLVETLAVLFVVGGFGQLVRGVIGVYKAYQEAKNDGKSFEFDATALGLSVLVGGLVGVTVGVMLDTVDPVVILPYGYFGGDALEGIFKNRKQ